MQSTHSATVSANWYLDAARVLSMMYLFELASSSTSVILPKKFLFFFNSSPLIFNAETIFSSKCFFNSALVTICSMVALKDQYITASGEMLESFLICNSYAQSINLEKFLKVSTSLVLFVVRNKSTKSFDMIWGEKEGKVDAALCCSSSISLSWYSKSSK